MNPRLRPFPALLTAGILLLPSLSSADQIQLLRQYVETHGVDAIQKPEPANPAKVELGQALFFDPEISGNRDVSCATCHHPTTSTSDSRSRSVGTKAYVDRGRRLPVGLSLVDVEGRDPVLMSFSYPAPSHTFTPRNSPDVFNRGDEAWHTMFWDGRIKRLDDGRFVVFNLRMTKSPEFYQVVLPDNVENTLAAQAMMPVVSPDEMRGEENEYDAEGDLNEVADIIDQNEEEIWDAIMERLLKIQEYRRLFQEAYPEKDLNAMNFADAANALAEFQIQSFTLTDSPWDRFLNGDNSALTDAQIRGANLFFGKASCVQCHSGRLMTDQQFYNIGVRPVGAGPDPEERVDYGAALRSHSGLDKLYAFRTTPLRNVELTGPYMHNGTWSTLEGAIRQHMDPVHHLWNFDRSQMDVEFRGAVRDEERVLEEVEANISEEIAVVPKDLTDQEVADLVEFLKALTAPSALDLAHLVPDSIPSGLEMILPHPEDPTPTYQSSSETE